MVALVCHCANFVLLKQLVRLWIGWTVPELLLMPAVQNFLFCCSLLPAGSLLGEQSLLMLPEPQHKYLRNLIMPAFTNEAIERLVPRMEAVLARYLDNWASAGAPVKAHNELRHMTFEFIVAVGAAAAAFSRLPTAFGRLFPAAYVDPTLMLLPCNVPSVLPAYPVPSLVSDRLAFSLL
jgi:cytochrome P450